MEEVLMMDENELAEKLTQTFRIRGNIEDLVNTLQEIENRGFETLKEFEEEAHLNSLNPQTNTAGGDH